MIAMQYSFVLPSDYDMSIIERRIQEKGQMLDNHSPLVFKAYLIARKGETTTRSPENLYAPLYLWHRNEGMSDFLCSAGFAGLVDSFGWPSVRSWPIVIGLEQVDNIQQARFATREVQQLVPFTALQTLRVEESRLTGAAVKEEGALLALSAFEPTTWTLVRFRLWDEAGQFSKLFDTQAYNVVHLSNPAAHT
jgi:hypothetical protein